MSNSSNTCSEATDTESPVILKSFSITLIVFCGLSLVILGSLFFRRRKRFAILKARSLLLISYVGLGAVYQLILIVDILLDSNGVPCFLIGHSMLMLFSIVVITTVSEIMIFYFKVKLNHALSNFELTSAVVLGTDNRMGQVEYVESPKRIKSLKALKEIALDKKQDEKTSSIMCCFLGKSQARLEKKLAESKYESSRALDELDLLVTKKELPPNYLFFLASNNFPKIITCFSVFLTCILLMVSIFNDGTCVSPCLNFDLDARLTGALCGIPTAIGLCFAYSIKDQPDPLNLKMDLLIANSFSLIFGLSGTIVYEVNPGDIQPELQYRWLLLWVIAVWGYILSRLAKPLWDSYQEEKLMKKGVLEVTLEDILKTSTGRNMFKAFLVTEFSVENYLFWREVTDYRDHFSSRTRDENETLRKIIADLYVGDSAKMQVNTSGRILRKIQENLQNEPGSDDFEVMFDSVYAMMNDDSFTRFRSTSMYRSLLWENESRNLA